MIAGPMTVVILILIVAAVLIICRKGIDMPTADLIKLVFMSVYAAGVTIGSFFFFFRIVFGEIPPDNQQYANLILGFLIGSGIPTFLGYYFGTSQSTKARPVDLPPNTTVTQSQTTTETSKETVKE